MPLGKVVGKAIAMATKGSKGSKGHTTNTQRDGGNKSGVNKEQRGKHEKGDARRQADQKRAQERKEKGKTKLNLLENSVEVHLNFNCNSRI